MLKKLLVMIVVILLLFAICATLEKKVSPDGTATQTESMFQMAVSSFKESVSNIKDSILGIFGKGSENNSEANANENQEIGEISVNQLPEEVQEVYKRYSADKWKTTTKDLEGEMKAGRKYRNDPDQDETKLPEKTNDGDEITYKEFDAEETPTGSNRGAKRFVHGSDGTTYYTDDHYRTFNKVQD